MQGYADKPLIIVATGIAITQPLAAAAATRVHVDEKRISLLGFKHRDGLSLIIVAGLATHLSLFGLCIGAGASIRLPRFSPSMI